MTHWIDSVADQALEMLHCNLDPPRPHENLHEALIRVMRRLASHLEFETVEAMAVALMECAAEMERRPCRCDQCRSQAGTDFVASLQTTPGDTERDT